MKKKAKKKINKFHQEHGCHGCPSYCCHDLAMYITRPTNKTERDELLWYLRYDTVKICISNHRWHILIEGKCIYLDKNRNCKIYDKRPNRCRRHNFPNCERTGKWYDLIFSTPEQLDDYLHHRALKKKK